MLIQHTEDSSGLYLFPLEKKISIYTENCSSAKTLG